MEAALGVGSHVLSADYLGDGSFSPSSSLTVSVTVSRAQTTTTLASSPNPSSRKQMVSVTATVAAVAPGAGTATGQVQFFEGKKKLGTVAVVNGVASLRVAFTSMGQHVLTATCAGDSNFSGGTAAPLTQTVSK
jgi:Bacterial Ig-like domain (group 3)